MIAPLDGVNVEETDKAVLLIIESFSEELQEIVDQILAGIWHGFAEINDFPDLFTLSNAAKSFLDIYNTKSLDTKKGMIGELLANVLIKYYLPKYSQLTVLKNLEERSIKKGFDIIYYENQNGELWYCEVKSGLSTDGAKTSNEYNSILIDRSKSGIIEMLSSGRNKLWEKAMVEAKLAVDDQATQINVRTLLSQDLKAINDNDLKNVVLVSVLYHSLSDLIRSNDLHDKHLEIENDNLFQKHLIVSIQKSTLEVVENYLNDRSNG
ncbi:MAG: hypothetical protein AAF600_04665 [Bacteroidota bacterium]